MLSKKTESVQELLNENKELGKEKRNAAPVVPEKEISIRENPKLEKLRSAPEEVVAKAIREMIRKDT